MKKFSIEVEFSTSICVDVWANSKDDAMDKAEVKAAEEFRDLMDKGYLGTSDFYCNAQTP